MHHQRDILEAYLTAALAQYGMTLDNATLDLFDENIQLIPRPVDESEETRSIEQKQDSSGKHSAESFKLMNIARLSTEDILKFIGQYGGIALFDETVKKVIYGFVMLLIDFYPKLKIQFSEQEAQVIYAISKLPEKTFTTEEVQHSFLQIFPQGLSTERMEASLQVLTENYVLHRTAAQTYELKERIKNLAR